MRTRNCSYFARPSLCPSRRTASWTTFRSLPSIFYYIAPTIAHSVDETAPTAAPQEKMAQKKSEYEPHIVQLDDEYQVGEEEGVQDGQGQKMDAYDPWAIKPIEQTSTLDDWEDAFDDNTGDFEVKFTNENEQPGAGISSNEGWEGPSAVVVAASKEVPVLVLNLTVLMGGTYQNEHGNVVHIDHQTDPSLVEKLEQKIERNMKGLQRPGELASVGTPVASAIASLFQQNPKVCFHATTRSMEELLDSLALQEPTHCFGIIPYPQDPMQVSAAWVALHAPTAYESVNRILHFLQLSDKELFWKIEVCDEVKKMATNMAALDAEFVEMSHKRIEQLVNVIDSFETQSYCFSLSRVSIGWAQASFAVQLASHDILQGVVFV